MSISSTSEKQTVQCPIHKREFPLATCLARQKIIATKPTSGLKGEAYNQFKLSCGVIFENYMAKLFYENGRTGCRKINMPTETSRGCGC